PLEAKPSDPEANGKLGMLFHAFEQLGAAEIFYRRARLLDPARARWAYYLGLVLALDGKNEEAASNLREAIRIDPGYVPARLKLAEVLVAVGKPAESRDVSDAVLKDNPQVSPAYYWLGRADAAEGKTDQAAERYRKACELWPTYG